MSIAIRQFVNGVNDKRVAKALNGMLDRMLPTKLDTAITAKASGVQADATPLNPDASFHDVTVVATAADAIALPPARVGQLHIVKNSDSAQSMQVFAPDPDTIDGVATATGVPHPAGASVLYACLVDGNYVRLTGVTAGQVAELAALTATAAEINRATDISARIVTTTATTLALTVTQHAERVVLINTNSTVANTFSLPAATGSGAKFTLINNIAQTQGTIVVAANGTDVIRGLAVIADTTAETSGGFLTSATSDKYTFDLTTTGGLGGDQVEAYDIAANLWRVSVIAAGSGTLATGWAAT